MSIIYFIAVTKELRRLEDLAPVDFSPISATTKEKALQQYHSTMTKGQLRRMIPGFMRVEVLLDEQNYPAQSNTGPVPVDLSFSRMGPQRPNGKPSTLRLVATPPIIGPMRIDPADQTPIN